MSVSKFVESHIVSLAAGTAVAVGIYVLYGPSYSGGRGKKTEVRGLVNSGNSCFVNAVIQALASCPTLYFWLEENVTKRDGRTVRGCLQEVLSVLNNLAKKTAPDPYTPSQLLGALRLHGWVINTEEQDAHEMLHVIMTTIEEELTAKKSMKKPSHASLLDISNIGLSSSDSDEEDFEYEQDFQRDNRRTNKPPDGVRSRTRGISLPPEAESEFQDSGLIFRACVSRDTSPAGGSKRSRRRSGVISKLGEQLPSSIVSSFTKPKCQTPFTGLLTSKLTYSSGKSHSPVHYSTFNNITLNLPGGGLGAVSLETLLQMFVSQERVENCSGGVRQESFVKQITFGKLPDCLCFHIQRTGFAGGQPYKRHDYVEFPIILDMDRFTHTSQLNKTRNIHSLMNTSGGPSSLSSNLYHQALYQLRAVTVHAGGINSGHYITYRKGPLGSKNSSRWFYTSDCLVKQVPFSEVSRAPAYMLFYERETVDGERENL